MYRTVGYIERDPETGLYVAVVPGIPGAHTQAETLDELQKNLKEVVELCLEEMSPEDKKQLPEFVGVQQVEVAV
jgi:predicted RNase H-like HicB family nuclease